MTKSSENNTLEKKIEELEKKINFLEKQINENSEQTSSIIYDKNKFFVSRWISLDRGQKLSIEHDLNQQEINSGNFLVSTLVKTFQGTYKHDNCSKLEWNWEINTTQINLRRLKNDNKFYRDRSKDMFRIIILVL
jgi:hypothetical protein